MSSPRTVTLPAGITVPKVGFWLYESCPEADQHSLFPADFNANQTSPSKTHRQAKHVTCGLWTQWIPKGKR
jgi:hypothetical protein